VQIQLDTVLPCSYERAVAEVKKPGLLSHVARPFVIFEPAGKTVVRDRWEEATYWFHLRLFGFLPFGTQAVCITFDEDANGFRLRDNGHSRLIRRWDHRITIRRENGHALYRDTLDLDAGLATPFVCLFARIFFAHRQRRWVGLAQSGFDYSKA
jgi:hypothetical protein